VSGTPEYRDAVWKDIAELEECGLGPIIQELMDSPNVISIINSPPGDSDHGFTNTRANDDAAAEGGAGTGSVIQYDPGGRKTGSKIPDSCPKRSRPSDLAHELGHALENDTGSAPSPPERDPSWVPVTDPGIPAFEQLPIDVENIYRANAGLPLRDAY
jgi:hypothetical protein